MSSINKDSNKDTNDDIDRNSYRTKSEIKLRVKQYITHIVSIIFMIIVLIGFLKLDENTDIFGYNIRLVTSSSMEPSISKGNICVIKYCDIEDLKVGDIVCYKYCNRDIIHRVYEVDSKNNSVRTKGDTNKSVDDFVVSDGMLLGIVEKIITVKGIVYTDKDAITVSNMHLISSSVVIIALNIIILYVIYNLILLLSVVIKSVCTNTISDDSIKLSLITATSRLNNTIDTTYGITEEINEFNESEYEYSNRFRYLLDRFIKLRTEEKLYRYSNKVRKLNIKLRKYRSLDKFADSVKHRKNDNLS